MRRWWQYVEKLLIQFFSAGLGWITAHGGHIVNSLLLLLPCKWNLNEAFQTVCLKKQNVS